MTKLIKPCTHRVVFTTQYGEHVTLRLCAKSKKQLRKIIYMLINHDRWLLTDFRDSRIKFKIYKNIINGKI